LGENKPDVTMNIDIGEIIEFFVNLLAIIIIIGCGIYGAISIIILIVNLFRG
jgi:hypothetical protein